MGEKYESDLSRQEKLEQQWKTIRSLKGKKKLEYLWSYYKVIPVILLAVILVVYTAGVMIRNGKENTVLSIVIVDAEKNDDEAAEELEKQFLHILGADGRYDHVETVLSASSAQTEENIAKLRVSLSVVGEADLVVCSKEVYEEYAGQGAFADETVLLGADAEKAQAYMTDGQIDLSKCPENFLSESVSYSPAYLCVLGHTERSEAAEAVLKALIR